MAAQVPKLALNNGKNIPILGLGTWKSKPGEVTEAVKEAIACGYRHIDCALAYSNEAEVGAAIKAKIEDGTVKREDLFITSKLWNTFHSRALVTASLKQSLGNLGLDYLDLYLIHWPMGYQENAALFPKDENGKFIYADVDYLDTWSGMEDAVDQGLSKSIGISNFNSEQIQRILSNCRIKPANHQIECHPYLNQRKLIDFCHKNGITVTAYSPLGSPDRPWAKPGETQLNGRTRGSSDIAEKYKKSPDLTVLFPFQIQRQVIVIPKSVTKARIEANFQVFDFTLSDEDIKVIDSFDCNGRLLHLDWVKDHKYWPFNIEF
ncbi:aldo-keto reductase family 1 member B1-like [Penaeus indicus]|uniref:aldo-keto reductase family 1 member B1-like n=2 Tax=Penaeus indicus TaxID=29960 RepID=UPI00300D8D35